jgi:hypothetical protein
MSSAAANFNSVSNRSNQRTCSVALGLFLQSAIGGVHAHAEHPAVNLGSKLSGSNRRPAELLSRRSVTAPIALRLDSNGQRVPAASQVNSIRLGVSHG